MAAAILATLTFIIMVMTLIPWLPFAHGLVRVCDIPRLQIIGLGLGLILLTLALLPISPIALSLLAVQIAVVITQAAVCLRFSRFWRVQSLAFLGSADSESVFRIIAANVKMSNRDHGKLISLLEERDPHIAILMEVDDAWLAALAPVKERLAFTVEHPLSNSYGMALLSRLPLVQPEVRFLLLPNVPSIKTAVSLPDGRSFRLYVLHPEPPVPYEDTLGRDGELILAAREVKADRMPAVVAGDLNDVAWSRTTRRFQRLSGLLDPRVGRGFFNSFHARYPFLRWPLDHLFHDPRFRLAKLERLQDIGSDHFPILFELALSEAEAAGEEPGEPDSDDLAEAHEVVRRASNLDRRPVGTDWEK